MNAKRFILYWDFNEGNGESSSFFHRAATRVFLQTLKIPMSRKSEGVNLCLRGREALSKTKEVV
ncbi:hypothetical protein GLYMA_04G040100v4 [Glycine max]|uniref:Uncharacterized protein n=2 Tax=Glycine subgen. Soja TaxID=1462606 RepID=A0A0R0K3K5_SOYBN|nr:hypothetical protein JHK87_008871 [Glycine soja]KAG5048160.1 hypothetical protein JHK85_009263 [Glycine max]KAG5065282.1 hypothetical protein JHK86_009013 [Glycine max]KAH1109683.1 hypothetical protein GYH30_008872 [Glycine max]KRH61318.1 hypothetical protein GLYMA_04G040100v4 [Glycine max]